MEILYYSSRGPMVALLQHILNKLGFNAGEVDGIFGDNTLSAVKDFQRSRGLAQSGVVWPETWEELLSYIYTQGVFSTLPYSSELLKINLDGLKRQYPDIKSRSIGFSVLGEPIRMISLGNQSKKVMFNASHHANEWITTPLAVKFLFDILKSEDSGGEMYGINVSELLERVGLDCIPMVNPDGVDLVTGQIRAGAIYNDALALNTAGTPFPDGWKANIRGVDLNLNYPAGWDRARELKFAAGYTVPGPRDYVGPYPLSEPETEAMVRQTREGDYLLTVSLHTQGEVIFWTFEDYMPPRAREIGLAMERASGYVLDTPGEFSSYAGYKDWFLQTYERPGYTPECGRGVNPLPIEQFEEIYAHVAPMLIVAMNEISK